jgi:hypothetical protein
MAKQRANYVLLSRNFRPAAGPSASAIKPPSQQWAVKLQRQSSVANNTLTEINAQDLLPAISFSLPALA